MDERVLQAELKAAEDSGFLDAQRNLEAATIQSFLQDLGGLKIEDHLGFVKLRGMIDGIKILQSRREDIVHYSNVTNKSTNQKS